MKDTFNTRLADSQATVVQPVSASTFDFDRFVSYETELSERCRHFWQSDSGVLVYRRMRVKEVFAEDCRNPLKSLEWQLGALQKSMLFKADIPNFLEPWYGIGTVASAFGFDYVWEPGQAPAVKGSFASTKTLLDAPFKPVAETEIGMYTLEMIDYFLEKTLGRLPMSFCDVQSPLNTLSNIIDTSSFYMDFYLDAEAIHLAMDRCAELLVDFTLKQKTLIGDTLAKPGHGFASSRWFEGFGMSDDSATMLSPDLYTEMTVPYLVKAGLPFGGPVFHSCGNWSDKKSEIVRIKHLRAADGAFSLATDPGANSTKDFAETFANTGVVLNARMVGSPALVEEKVRELWKPGMKLIVVTFCETPKEQAYLYDKIHEICQ